jgi:hypothetical protein
MTLASFNVDSIGGLALLFGSDVYWIAGNTLERVPIAGGPTETRAVLPDDCATTFALDSTRVYFTSGCSAYGVYEQAFGAYAGSAALLAATPTSAWELLLVGSELYWGQGDSSNAQVAFMSKSGGPVGTIPGLPFSPTMVADAKNIYWFDQPTTLDPPSGVVMSAPLGGLADGGAPVTLASSQPIPDNIAIGNGNLFWTNEGLLTAGFKGDSGTATLGSIASVPVTGGTPVTLLSGLSATPGSIAVDAVNLYFGVYATGGYVAKTPLGGGAVTTLAIGTPTNLMIDDTSVYYLDAGTQEVIRITPK